MIGDTPRDIACARADGVRVVAVATGPFAVEALADADAVVDDARAAAAGARGLALAAAAAHSCVASVGSPSSRRPVSSQVAGATSMCCVAAWTSRRRRCSGLDS